MSHLVFDRRVVLQQGMSLSELNFIGTYKGLALEFLFEVEELKFFVMQLDHDGPFLPSLSHHTRYEEN